MATENNINLNIPDFKAEDNKDIQRLFQLIGQISREHPMVVSYRRGGNLKIMQTNFRQENVTISINIHDKEVTDENGYIKPNYISYNYALGAINKMIETLGYERYKLQFQITPKNEEEEAKQVQRIREDFNKKALGAADNEYQAPDNKKEDNKKDKAPHNDIQNFFLKDKKELSPGILGLEEDFQDLGRVNRRNSYCYNIKSIKITDNRLQLRFTPPKSIETYTLAPKELNYYFAPDEKEDLLNYVKYKLVQYNLYDEAKFKTPESFVTAMTTKQTITDKRDITNINSFYSDYCKNLPLKPTHKFEGIYTNSRPEEEITNIYVALKSTDKLKSTHNDITLSFGPFNYSEENKDHIRNTLAIFCGENNMEFTSGQLSEIKRANNASRFNLIGGALRHNQSTVEAHYPPK